MNNCETERRPMNKNMVGHRSTKGSWTVRIRSGCYRNSSGDSTDRNDLELIGNCSRFASSVRPTVCHICQRPFPWPLFSAFGAI